MRSRRTWLPSRRQCLDATLGPVLAISIATRAPAADRVDNATLTGKMIMGYQGWFGCPGDGSGRGWVHWKSGDEWTVDMLPDTSELTPGERCDTGMKTADGKPVYVFSSQNPQTVDRHFAWMEQYGLEGVALQRFATQLLRPETKQAVDTVLENVRRGAEKHGRVFLLMYDLSGMPPDKLDLVFEDWQRLKQGGLTRSASYLRHRGRPVLGLWGLGFAGRNLSPASVGSLLDRLKNTGDGDGVSVIGGVPADWRTGENADPGWKAIWPRLDVISPWTVGAYVEDAGVDRYQTQRLIPDLAAAKAMGSDYMPVVFPGFSWANMMHARHEDGKALPNQIPRRSGQFYWRQVTDALSSGAPMLYTAMYDEVDEGTAMFKLTPSQGSVSPSQPVLTLDADGGDLPADWYLRMAGAATRAAHGPKRLPPFVSLRGRL